MGSTIKNLWESSILMKIIIVNVAVWVTLRVIAIIAMLFASPGLLGTALSLVEMPSRPVELLLHPWTLLTYMFAQFDLLHILFNMLWLYWFGVIFMQLTSPRRLLPVYIYGGLAGALLFFASYNLLPVFAGSAGGVLIGSSASVLAIVTATAIIAPDYSVGLMFIGRVSLKWIAIVTIAIDLLSLSGDNIGGHIAHIGGALMGAAYALRLRRGVDLAAPFNRVADAIVNLLRHRRPAPRVKTRRSAPKADKSAPPTMSEIDSILDKIKKSGYTSLTADERAKLFRKSNER